MSIINELYAALGDGDDLTTANALKDAKAAAEVASTTLADAEAALTAANDAVVDPGNVTPEEQTAIDDAQALVDAATTDKATADAAVVTAQGAHDTASTTGGDTVALAAALPITDFGMISNDQARAILAARGEEVKFEEPEVVHSDYNMNPII